MFTNTDLTLISSPDTFIFLNQQEIGKDIYKMGTDEHLAETLKFNAAKKTNE
jgi:hypothetical protein